MGHLPDQVVVHSTEIILVKLAFDHNSKIQGDLHSSCIRFGVVFQSGSQIHQILWCVYDHIITRGDFLVD